MLHNLERDQLFYLFIVYFAQCSVFSVGSKINKISSKGFYFSDTNKSYLDKSETFRKEFFNEERTHEYFFEKLNENLTSNKNRTLSNFSRSCCGLKMSSPEFFKYKKNSNLKKAEKIDFNQTTTNENLYNKPPVKGKNTLFQTLQDGIIENLMDEHYTRFTRHILMKSTMSQETSNLNFETTMNKSTIENISTMFFTANGDTPLQNINPNISEATPNHILPTADLWLMDSTPWLNETHWDDCSINQSSCNLTLEHAPKFVSYTMIKGCVLLCLGTIAVIGNVWTLASIMRRGRQNSSTVYLLLVHLSVADLMVTWFCIIGEGLWTLTVQWYAGNLLCKLFKFLQMLALYLSTFILVVIGFDRLCAVRFPMRRVRARRQVNYAIVIAWSLSVVFSAPQAVIFRLAKGPFLEEFWQCVTHGFYTKAWQEQLYTSVTLCCMFLIPLVVLIATYAATFATIVNSGRSRVFGRSPFEDARCKVLRKARVKSLWITVVIVSTFIVCWTPYYVSMVVSVFMEDSEEQLHKGLHDAIFFFGSSTAVLNPVIYGAFHLGKGATGTSSVRSRTSSMALSTLRRPPSLPKKTTETTRIDLF